MARSSTKKTDHKEAETDLLERIRKADQTARTAADTLAAALAELGSLGGDAFAAVSRIRSQAEAVLEAAGDTPADAAETVAAMQGGAAELVEAMAALVNAAQHAKLKTAPAMRVAGEGVRIRRQTARGELREIEAIRRVGDEALRQDEARSIDPDADGRAPEDPQADAPAPKPTEAKASRASDGVAAEQRVNGYPGNGSEDEPRSDAASSAKSTSEGAFVTG